MGGTISPEYVQLRFFVFKTMNFGIFQEKMVHIILEVLEHLDHLKRFN
jgi:hypothetical protein